MSEKILLIGNGPCALDEERGAEIDDFEGKIVRFNGYHIDGYEKHIGTRTDILFIGQLNMNNGQLDKEYDYIVLYQAKLDGGMGLRKLKEQSPHNEIKFYPICDKDKLKDMLEMPHKLEPTTGCMAIVWFLNRKCDVYLYGFDFTTRGFDYFPSNKTMTDEKCHDTARERVYVDWLCENNMIKWF